MALGAREMLIIVRARDEASRVFMNIGRSMSSVSNSQLMAAQRSMALGGAMIAGGTAMAAVGLKTLGALNDMTDAAADYATQVALTKTQVDDIGISAKQLGDIGKRIGTELPVAFSDIQPALYDIFSSIEVNAPQAEALLYQIGKAAVGGKTDMVTSGKAIIGILNAYKIPVENASQVTDTLFQLVKDGVGTYEEFSVVLGKAMPSAIKAGQSLESLSGMFAFMTRNGMSAAEAATSAARALDAVSNPKTIAKLQTLGINVADAAGNFRPMVDIMQDLKGKLSGMDEVARASALKDIFKGSGGTIQAMRFFNMAVTDSNGLLPLLTANMNNAGGAADNAFAIMKEAPLSKIQLMNNKWEILKITIGEKLLPAKLKLYDIITKIIDVFLKLSPAVQGFIVKAVVIGSVLAVLIGTITAVVGLIVFFQAGMTLLGIGLGAIAVPVLIIIGVLALLAAAIYFGIKYWDEIKNAAIVSWNYIKDITMSVVDKIIVYWNKLWSVGTSVWSGIQAVIAAFIGYWNSTLWPAINAVVQTIINSWNALYPSITNVLGATWDFISKIFNAIIDKGQELWSVITKYFGKIIQAFAEFGPMLSPMGEAAARVFGWILNIIEATFQTIWRIVKPAIELITKFISNGLNILANAFKMVLPIILMVWNVFMDIVIFAAGIIGVAIKLIVDIFRNVVGIITSLINGDVYGALYYFLDIFSSIFGAVGNLIVEAGKFILNIITDLVMGIVRWFAKLPGFILSVLMGFINSIIGFFKFLWDVIVGHSIIPDLINAIVDWFASMPGKVLSLIIGWVSDLIGWFVKTSVDGIAVIAGFIGDIVSWFFGLPGRILTALASLASTLASELFQKFLDVGLSIWNWITVTLPGYLEKVGSYIVSALSDVAEKIMKPFKDGYDKAKEWADKLKNLITGTASLPPEVQAAVDAANAAKSGGASQGFGRDTSDYFRAAGGAVSRGRAYIVGENGPEWHVPDQDGYILPNGVSPIMRDGGGSTVQNFYITTQEIDPRKHAADLGWELATRADV